MIKHYKRFILLLCVVLMGGLSMYYSSGPAQSFTAATGSSFDGQNCNSCHSGGSFSTTLTMQLLDGSLNPVTTYVPGTAYTLRITAGGTSPRLGFQTTAAFQGTNANINGWGAMPVNVQNIVLGGRNYVEHSTPLNLSVVNIPWTAPASTTTVVFYTAINRVNNTGSTSGDQVVSGSLSIAACAPIVMTPSPLPGATINVGYSQQLSQTGGVGTVTYALTSGTMPTGITINGTGLISGTPTVAGTYNFTITATGSNGCSSAQSFTIVVCPVITLTPGSPLPSGTVAAAYSQVISQTGGTGTFTYTVTAGTLPAGVTLNTNGTLSGTPLTAGTYNFTITGTNGSCSGTTAYTLVIGCPTITVNPATLANGTPGVAYNQAITQTGGGAGPYNYTVTAGALPPGMTLSLAGTLGGTPTTSGTYNFTVTATGTQSNCSGTRSYTLIIACPTITVNPATLPNGTVGSSYGIQNITQTGGNGTMTYTVGTGFPPGLNLTTGGILSGTPTAAGTYTFTITVTSQYGCTGTRTYTVTISCPTITINPATIANTTPGSTVNVPFSQVGGTGTFTYTHTSGTLPPGLSVTGGALTGTVGAPGSYTFTITGTSTNGCTGTRTYTVIVACPTLSLSPGVLPTGNVNVPFSQVITVTGSSNTFTYTVTSGSLPAGVTLNTNGTLSGTPTASGTFTFTITATDIYGCTTSTVYNWVISPCPVITLNPNTLPNGAPGTAYSQTITQTGGTNPTTYAVISGALPPGLTLATGGGLTGTPTTPGTYTFTVQSTSVGGCIGSQTYTIIITCPTITLSPGTLPVDTVGTAYNETITQTGSLGSTFTYTVSSGSLPPGITLATNGDLTGTGTATGTYTFDVTMTDNQGCSVTVSYTIDVVCPVIVINQTIVDTIFATVPYTTTLTQTGGTAPYTYAVTNGTLPTGITLGTDGVLSGTSTNGGTFTVTVTVTDANGCTATQVFNIVVYDPLSVVKVDANKASVVLLPNNVTNTTTALIVTNSSIKAELRVVDITGKVVYHNTANLKAGENRVSLDLHQLASGTYTLHVKPLNVAPVRFNKQ